MDTETRYVGGMFVVQNASLAERQINEELQRLDPFLFLDKEWDTNRDCGFYAVKYHRGDRPPDLILDWRDADDWPRPLSAGIVAEVRRLQVQGAIDFQAVMKRNAELQERKRRASEQAYRDVAADFERYESAVHSPVLHRSQSLRISRDKMRAAGRKV